MYLCKVADLFIPGEIAHITYWTGSWMGPRADVNTVTEREKHPSSRELNPDSPVRNLVTILTELVWLQMEYIHFLNTIFLSLFRFGVEIYYLGFSRV
jgi:hypothetical protein